MLGAVIKGFYAKAQGLDPKNIFTVSIMPCTAKKYECQRPEMKVDDNQDVDAVLTTRELAKMLKTSGVNFKTIEESDPKTIYIDELTELKSKIK